MFEALATLTSRTFALNSGKSLDLYQVTQKTATFAEISSTGRLSSQSLASFPLKDLLNPSHATHLEHQHIDKQGAIAGTKRDEIRPKLEERSRTAEKIAR